MPTGAAQAEATRAEAARLRQQLGLLHRSWACSSSALPLSADLDCSLAGICARAPDASGWLAAAAPPHYQHAGSVGLQPARQGRRRGHARRGAALDAGGDDVGEWSSSGEQGEWQEGWLDLDSDASEDVVGDEGESSKRERGEARQPTAATAHVEERLKELAALRALRRTLEAQRAGASGYRTHSPRQRSSDGAWQESRGMRRSGSYTQRVPTRACDEMHAGQPTRHHTASPAAHTRPRSTTALAGKAAGGGRRSAGTVGGARSSGARGAGGSADVVYFGEHDVHVGEREQGQEMLESDGNERGEDGAGLAVAHYEEDEDQDQVVVVEGGGGLDGTDAARDGTFHRFAAV